MSRQSFVPLSFLFPWPEDLFPVSENDSEGSVIDMIGIEDFSYVDGSYGTKISIDAVILKELTVGYSGLEDWELVFGSMDGLTHVQATLEVGEQTTLT